MAQVAVLGVLILILGACGGSDNDDQATPVSVTSATTVVTTTSTTTTPPTTTDPALADCDLIQFDAATGDPFCADESTGTTGEDSSAGATDAAGENPWSDASYNPFEGDPCCEVDGPFGDDSFGGDGTFIARSRCWDEHFNLPSEIPECNTYADWVAANGGRDPIMDEITGLGG